MVPKKHWLGPGTDIIGKADNDTFYLLDPDTCRGPHCTQDAVIVDGKSYPKMPDKCYFKVSVKLNTQYLKHISVPKFRIKMN